MNQDDLHHCLTHDMGLLTETLSNSVSRTYYHARIERHPARSTRVVRVLYGSDGRPAAIQLCASSDTNHAVMMTQPFDMAVVLEQVRREIDRVAHR